MNIASKQEPLDRDEACQLANDENQIGTMRESSQSEFTSYSGNFQTRNELGRCGNIVVKEEFMVDGLCYTITKNEIDAESHGDQSDNVSNTDGKISNISDNNINDNLHNIKQEPEDYGYNTVSRYDDHDDSGSTNLYQTSMDFSPTNKGNIAVPEDITVKEEPIDIEFDLIPGIQTDIHENSDTLLTASGEGGLQLIRAANQYQDCGSSQVSGCDEYKTRVKSCEKSVRINDDHNKISQNLFVCPDCEFRSGDGNEMFSHFKTHRVAKKPAKIIRHHSIFSCPMCDFKTTDGNEVYQHFTTEHSRTNSQANTKFFSCPICGVEMANGQQMFKHYQQHRPIPKKNVKKSQVRNELFSCPKCDFKTSNGQAIHHHFKQHITTQH